MQFNKPISKLLKKQSNIENLLSDYRNLLLALDHNGLKANQLTSNKVKQLIQDSLKIDMQINQINNMMISNVNFKVDDKLHDDMQTLIDFAKNIHTKLANTGNINDCIAAIDEFKNSVDKFIEAYKPIVNKIPNSHVKKPYI
jgi:hypothetical protein